MFLDKLVRSDDYLQANFPSHADQVAVRRNKTILRWVERIAVIAALVTQVDTFQRNLFPEEVDVIDIVLDSQGNLDYQFGSDARD